MNEDIGERWWFDAASKAGELIRREGRSDNGRGYRLIAHGLGQVERN